MKYLGIDYGIKHIGVAVSDNTGSLAFPLTTIIAGRDALEKVATLAKEKEAVKIIVGESRNYKGEPNVVMEDIERFKNDLAKLTQLSVLYEPEFLTSAQAARQFAPQEKSRKENPSHEQLDAATAAIILQSYLDRNKKVEWAHG